MGSWRHPLSVGSRIRTVQPQALRQSQPQLFQAFGDHVLELTPERVRLL